MNKFKTGDEIVRINTSTVYAPKGYKSKVIDGYKYYDKDGDASHIIEMCWELVATKWTIYNNTLPWSQLSDKQKGKLLVADNNGLIFNGLTFNNRPQFIYYNAVYTVTKPEAVNPEPTMAEMFVSDWKEKESMYKKDVADHMIAKGWSK
jgi:hypothetical protein